MTFNYYSILFIIDIIFQNRTYFYSLNEELIFGSLFLLLSFFVVVTGNQSPADVHVVPESTASLWPFSGRTERCVSLEIPSVVHTVLGEWEDLSVSGSCFIIWLHHEVFSVFLLFAHLYYSPSKTSPDVSPLHWLSFIQRISCGLLTPHVFVA